jgi:hypothetical protein
VNGVRANSMAKESISKKAKRDKVFGRWVKELNGSRTPKQTNEHSFRFYYVLVINKYFTNP